MAAARHEAIHHLRNYGFFKPAEWETLTNEALAGGWLSKYNIDKRYPEGSPSLKLEEAVAEAYQDWAGRQDALKDRAAETAQVPSPLDAIFQKMKDFFDAIKERLSQLLGKEATWEDIFKKVDTGEVGAREGTEPLDPRAFNEKLEREISFQRDDNVRRYGEKSLGENDERPVLDENESLYKFKNGNKEGHVIIELEENGKHLHVRWVGTGTGAGEPNSIGLGAIRGLREAIANEYPQAQTIGGARISGAGGSMARQVDVRVPLRSLPEKLSVTEGPG